MKNIKYAFIFVLFFVSFIFDIKFINIKNGHFIDNINKKIKKTFIANNEFKISKIIIERMELELDSRIKTINYKVKILFNMLTFIFSIFTSAIVYLISSTKENIIQISIGYYSFNILYLITVPILFFLCSFFMILEYYNVSYFNRISYPNLTILENKKLEYLSDRLFCIEINNFRIDYKVEIFISAFRLFFAGIVTFVIFLLYFSFTYKVVLYHI